MQVQPVTSPTTLKQGSIFTLKGLFFQGEEGSALSIQQLCPHLALVGAERGIVFSQSCDLYRGAGRPGKSAFISVGFLYPFGQYIPAAGIDWSKATLDWRMPGADMQWTLYCPKALVSQISKQLSTLLQNNSDDLFFVSFTDEPLEKRYFFLTLAQALTLRPSDYDSVLKNVTHELTTEFENKLGWKLADLYGRVGTTDYTPKNLSGVVEELIDLAAPAALAGIINPLPVNPEQFKRAKELKADLRSTAREELFLQITGTRPLAASDPAATGFDTRASHDTVARIEDGSPSDEDSVA